MKVLHEPIEMTMMYVCDVLDKKSDQENDNDIVYIRLYEFPKLYLGKINPTKQNFDFRKSIAGTLKFNMQGDVKNRSGKQLGVKLKR